IKKTKHTKAPNPRTKIYLYPPFRVGNLEQKPVWLHTAIRTNGSSCDRRTAATLTIATSASNTSSDRLRRCTPRPLITLRATAAPRRDHGLVAPPAFPGTQRLRR